MSKNCCWLPKEVFEEHFGESSGRLVAQFFGSEQFYVELTKREVRECKKRHLKVKYLHSGA